MHPTKNPLQKWKLFKVFSVVEKKRWCDQLVQEVFQLFLSFRFPFVLSLLKKSFDGLCVFVSIFVYRFVRLVLCREIFHCLCRRSRFLVCPPSSILALFLDVCLSTAARCDGKVCFKCFSLEEWPLKVTKLSSLTLFLSLATRGSSRRGG